MRTPVKKERIGKSMQHDMHMTAEEVGKELGVSRQAVSDMEHKIFKKLRKLLRNKGIEAKDILPDD